MEEQLLTADELKQLGSSMGLTTLECSSISSNIILANLSYKDFFNLVKYQDASTIYYINIVFDHSEIELLDELALKLIPNDILDKIKVANNKVMKTKLSYIKDGVITSIQYINDELVELDTQVKDIYQQLDNHINAINRQTLKTELLNDANFALQTSQTKRAMYVKENYNELLNESKLLGSELTYFLDSIYSELKSRNK